MMRMITRSFSLAGAFHRCKRGAAATELALLMPMLTSLVLGVFEFGTVIYAYSGMQFGANRVARTVSVNQMTTEQALATVKNYVPAWARDDVSVSITQSKPSDTNVNLVNVRLSVSADRATPLPLLTRLVPWQLTATSVMKQELPYVD